MDVSYAPRVFFVSGVRAFALCSLAFPLASVAARLARLDAVDRGEYTARRPAAGAGERGECQGADNHVLCCTGLAFWSQPEGCQCNIRAVIRP